MREDFRQRQSAALRRRLYPNTGVTAKMLAHSLGRHADTVLGWHHGNATMSGDSIEATDRFFAGIGDWGFLSEIYGDWKARALQRADQLEQQATTMRANAALMGQVA